MGFFIFHDLKMVYTIVPGTGSNSFHRAVRKKYKNFKEIRIPKHHEVRAIRREIGHESHVTAEQIRRFISPDVWQNYEKIAFVRHPYAWARSIYRKDGIKNALGEDNSGSFVQFLKTLGKTPYSWYTDSNGNMLIDTIYRTEDLQSICDKLGIEYRHDNITKADNKEAQQTEEVKQLLVKKFYREYQHYPGIGVFENET